ncbi:hypothetical protein RvY_18981 [Ramazzottius varieornatus]|uniref:SUZ domain-containing protein n=1 Tax=Ramazzottius varieornatus TaxID=947166 RepID=A0A1D1W7S1_RAMVA|nr:hypothetical protein RvY_18981 [Ramazzottius varieornatus]
MADPGSEVRCKNYKLEKQDEVELSDEEAALSLPLHHSPQQQQQFPQKPYLPQSRSKLGGAGQPVPVIISPTLAENERREWSRSGGHRTSSSAGEEAASSGRAVPVASMQIVNNYLGNADSRRHDSIPTPRHLGSLAFSSMSTEETSSICDTEALSRYMGSLSVQESLQDDLAKKDGSMLDFLISTWHQQPQDRLNMLRFEKMLEEMLESNDEELRVSQALNSYYRMLLHRMAQVWDIEHNTCYVQGSQGQGVSLKLTPRSARPDHLFREMPEPVPEEAEMGKGILQRPKTQLGLSEGHFKGQQAATGPTVQSLSLQERQANYDQVRQRIFGQSEGADGGNLSVTNRKQYFSGSREAGPSGRNYSGQYRTSRMPLYNDNTGQAMIAANYEASSLGPPYGEGSMLPNMNSGYGGPSYGYGAAPYAYYMPFAQPHIAGEASLYGSQQQPPQNVGRLMQAGQAGTYPPSMAHPGQPHYEYPPHFLNMYPPTSFTQPMYLPEEGQYQMAQLGYGSCLQQQPAAYSYPSPMQAYGQTPFPQQPPPLINYAASAGLSATPPEFESGANGQNTPHSRASPLGRFLSTSQMGQGSEGQEGNNDSLIIPLQLPTVKGDRPNMNLGMYLKLPCVRSKTQGEDTLADERASLNSRNSAYSANQDF